MSLFLTKADIAYLTGYQRPSCQIRWLREQGIRHFVAADGHPRVARSQIEEPASTSQSHCTEPDFSSLRKMG